MGSEKQWVTKEFSSSLGSMASLDEVEEALKEARAAEAKGEWKEFELVVEDDYGYHCLKMYGKRLETDDEQKRRLADEEAQRYRLDQEERRKYEELKKKFG